MFSMFVNSPGSVVAAVFGIAILLLVLLDAFETMVLPRRVLRNFKLTADFYRRAGVSGRWVAPKNKNASRPQNFLRYFRAPSVVVLLAGSAAGAGFCFCA